MGECSDWAFYGEKERRMMVQLEGIQEKITGVRIYLKNIHAKKRFSFGTWTSRQHLIVAVRTDRETGYAESIAAVNTPDMGLLEYEAWSGMFNGMGVTEALIKNRDQRGIRPEHYVEMMEMALIDLAGKIKRKSALELLELSGREPVYGVYVILSDDLADVAKKAAWAKAHGRDRFIKVKLFGDNALDCDVIRTVRANAPGKDTYLIGDVNGGYRKKGENNTVEEIAGHLNRLYEAGLSACEDPAYMELTEWVELQELVGGLSLIPDYPMRPSRISIHQILPGMGRIYNIHPDSAGSILDAIALAKRIRQMGAGLMVGDDSLVGPSASIWQQLAVGLGAEWVEATEKEGESDFYYKAAVEIPTDSRINPIHVKPCHGFGIVMDEEILKAECDKIIEVRR